MDDKETPSKGRLKKGIVTGVIVFCVVVISLVCFHSVEEIHYLKSFFPGKFSVEEALYASRVELIKVVIISLPLIIVIVICLSLVGRSQKKDD